MNYVYVKIQVSQRYLRNSSTLRGAKGLGGGPQRHHRHQLRVEGGAPKEVPAAAFWEVTLNA